MTHRRKKGGERKDKKNERMRETWAHNPKAHPDQPDTRAFKSRGADDHDRQEGRYQP